MVSMAVYTKIDTDALRAFLRQYDLGELISFEGILAGVENTNYHVFTDQGRYVLTLFEKRVQPEELPFFFSYTSFLNDHDILCPKAIPARQGDIITTLAGKPAVIVSFLEGAGVAPADISIEHCADLGQYLARMHMVSSGFKERKSNTMGIEAWQLLFEKTKSRADEVENGLSGLLEEELGYLERRWPDTLPKAVVHADMFPDNVFFKDNKTYGVIDFYFSCTEILLYDLALVLNAWCFDTKDNLDKIRLSAFMNAYQNVRPLTDAERAAFSLLCRAAALRILMTRLHDWSFHPGDEFVKPKLPNEYINKLKFHQRVDINDIL